MGAENERLEVQVEAQATKANNALDSLVSKLEKLEGSLKSINTSGLTGMFDGIIKFSQASSQLSNVKTTDFTRLVKNIEKLSAINTKELYGASHGMRTLVNAMNGFGSVSANSVGVVDFANSISKLGGANVQKAITNLPALATAMNNLMTTLLRAPQVSNNVIQMTKALAALSTQGAKIGTASNSLNQSLNSTGNAMATTTKKAFSLSSAIGKLYQSYYWVIRAGNKLWDSIENSMSYIENLNYFDAAFGQVADAAVSQWEEAGYNSADAYYESFSNRAKELTSKMTGFNVNDDGALTATGDASLGINPSKLMNYQAMFAQMSSSMGVASETSLKLSQALTEIGADLASVKNMDFDKVWTDMASGLAGMSRTLDKYGVNIRNVNLQQKLMELGIDENITNLNQNDKALLRTIILLDSTKYAWCDLADTLNQPANQMRLLTSNINNLSRTVGNLFLPMLSKALPYVNGLVIALQRLATWLGNLMGIDLSEITSGIGSSEVDIAGLLDDASDLTDNLDDASNAAKKLKSNLQGFDELNVITTQEDASGVGDVGGGLSSGLLDAAFEDAFSEYQKAWDEAFANMENRAEEFADKIEGFLQPIKDIINDFAVGDFFKAGQDTSKLVTGIFNFFADAIDDVDWYEIGENIGDYFRGIDWFKVLGSIGNLMWQALKASWELYIGALSTAPLETALISLASMPNLLKLITASKFVTGFKKLATNTKLLTAALAGNKKSTTVLLQQYPKLGKAVDVARKAFTNFQFGVENGNFLTGLDNGISTIRNNLTGLQKGAITTIAGLAEFTIISNTFEGLVDGSENLVAGIAKIGGAATIAGVAMYTALGPAGVAIAGVTALVAAVNGINDAFDAIRAEEIGNTIKNAMSSPGGTPLSEITSNFADALNEASEGFTIISDKSSEMDNVQRNIETTWTEIYKIQEAMENGVLSVEEGKAQLETLFSELATLTEQKFSAMNSAILSAYGENGSFRSALEQMGVDTEAAIDTMITYGYQNSERAKEIAQQLTGVDINSEEYKTLTAELASLTGEMDAFAQATSDFAYDMNSLKGSIDYSEIFAEDGTLDAEALKGYLDEAATALNGYKTDLDTAGQEISRYWQEIYNSATATEEQKALAKTNLDYIPQAVESMKTDAELQIISFTDMIQNDFIAKTNQIIDDEIASWNEKSPVEQWWNGVWGAGTESEYVKEAVDQQQKNIDELSSAIEESFGTLKMDGVAWASDAATEIYDALFDSEYHHSEMGPGHRIYTLKEDYKEIIEGATEGIADLAAERGKDAVDGYANGFSDNAEIAENSATNFIDGVMEAIAKAQDSHSPSKVTESLGKDAVDGYNLGFSKNTQSTLDTISTYMKTVKLAFEEFPDILHVIGTQAMNGLLNGISAMESSIYDKASDIADNIAKTIQTSLDIHSPSRVMFALGEYTMEGFQLGMENLYGNIQKSVSEFGGTLQYDIAPTPQLSYAGIPNNAFPATEYNNYSYYDSQNNYDATETNGLLRELLSAVRAGQVIECNGRELGRTVRNEDTEYYNRTGKGMFQH